MVKKVVVDKKVAVEKKKTEVATKVTETKMTKMTKMTECDVCHEMFETPTLAIQVRWNSKIDN